MQIVVGGRFDYMRTIWSKAIDEKRVQYFENDFFRALKWKDKLRSRIFEVLKKCKILSQESLTVHNALESLNEYVDVYSWKRKETILLILYEMNFLATDFQLLKNLKKRFKNLKIVLFFSNVIGTVRENLTNRILENRELYDLIYTFNPEDAKTYHLLTFCNGVFPYNIINMEEDDRYFSNVMWIGKNKARLSVLANIKTSLEEKRLSCCFQVTNEKDEIVHGIECTSQNIEYKEYLKYLYNSDAVLDLTHKGVNSLRYTEAIAYGKKLVTDNVLLKGTPGCIYLDDLQKNEKLLHEEEKWSILPEQISTESFVKEVLCKLNWGA